MDNLECLFIYSELFFPISNLRYFHFLPRIRNGYFNLNIEFASFRIFFDHRSQAPGISTLASLAIMRVYLQVIENRKSR